MPIPNNLCLFPILLRRWSPSTAAEFCFQTMDVYVMGIGRGKGWKSFIYLSSYVDFFLFSFKFLLVFPFFTIRVLFSHKIREFLLKMKNKREKCLLHLFSFFPDFLFHVFPLVSLFPPSHSTSTTTATTRATNTARGKTGRTAGTHNYVNSEMRWQWRLRSRWQP